VDLFTLFGRIAIESGDSEKEIDNITKKAQGLSEALDGTGEDANKTSSNLGANSKIGSASIWLGNMWTNLTHKALEVGKTMFKTGFDFNSNMERYQTSFSTLMGGNTEAAAALVEELRVLAAVTPMEMVGLASNAETLMGYQVAAEDVVDTLQMLGDLSIGDQSRLDRIVLAYSQMLGAGKLMAQDANQFVNAGVPLWGLLADHIGVAVGEVRKMSEEGLITSDVVTDVLKQATSEGGLFFNAMENQSTTYLGLMARLSDDFQMTMGSLFEPFFDETKTTIIPELTESLTEFNSWIETNKTSIQELATACGELVTGGLDLMIGAFQTLVTMDSNTLVGLQTLGGTVAFLTGHPVLGLSLFGEAGYTIKEDSEGGAAYKYHADENGELDIDAVSGATTWVEEKYNNLLKDGYNALTIPEVFGPPTPAGWTPASNGQNTEAVVAAIQSAVESIPGAVAAGFADATIAVNVTTGDVRLNTGALVGQILPHVNIGLGAIGALYGRGLS